LEFTCGQLIQADVWRRVSGRKSVESSSVFNNHSSRIRELCRRTHTHTHRRVMQPLGSFLLLVALLHVSRGSYVPCEACDRQALSLCAPVPAGCRERVKEPGCGCCLTCALADGQPCGVYTGPCARGLRCLPKDGEEKPLHALLQGRGACRNEMLLKFIRGGESFIFSVGEPRGGEVRFCVTSKT